MSLSTVTAELNGATYGSMYVAQVDAINTLGGGNYSVDVTGVNSNLTVCQNNGFGSAPCTVPSYVGSIYDFWGTSPSANIVTTTLSGTFLVGVARRHHHVFVYLRRQRPRHRGANRRTGPGL